MFGDVYTYSQRNQEGKSKRWLLAAGDGCLKRRRIQLGMQRLVLVSLFLAFDYQVPRVCTRQYRSCYLALQHTYAVHEVHKVPPTGGAIATNDPNLKL